MKKYLLALAAFAASAFVTSVSAEEQSVTYDFNSNASGYVNTNVKTVLGDDWGFYTDDNYKYGFKIQTAYPGPENSQALQCATTAANGARSALLYYAKGPGKISFEVSGYGYKPEEDDFVEFFSATYDGSAYSLGSSIVKFTGIEAGWQTKEVEIPETGWIAFKAGRVIIDNFTNTWEVASAAKTYSVSGTVVNAETKALVEGAKVAVVGGDNVTTGADGAFSFPEMADGEYMVNVSAPGFDAFQTKVTVDGADIADLKFEIDPQKSILKGYVLSILSDATPIKGAELSLYVPETETPVATATSGEDGSYALTVSGVLNAGGYTLTMSAPYYQDVTRTISTGGVAPCFRQGETVESTLYMTPKYVAFYANVMDADSTGITTATVLLLPEGAEEPIRAVNYGGGRYGVSNITAGNIAPSYTFTVSAPYYDNFTSEAFSFDGKDYTADVILAAETYTFSATVISRFGSAIEGASVTVDGKECEAGADGTFTWTVLASEAVDETFEAEATAPGYDAMKFEFDFKEAKAVSHTFMLTETKYTLLVFVTDKTDDAALADATVTVKDADGGQLNVTAQGNGSFSATVTALAATKTTYEVTASCEGYITSEAKTVNLAEGSVEITIALEPEPVSLDTVGADATGQAIFDLQGRRVSKAAKGTITISNGKKTLNL